MTSLQVSYRLLWILAREARDRAREHTQATPNVMTGDTLVSIVMAAASVEAAINEVAAICQVEVRQEEEVGSIYLPSEIRSFREVTIQDGFEKGEVLFKYQLTAAIFRGQPFTKGAQPYQDLSRLISLRNSIIHMKPKGSWSAIGGIRSITRPGKAGFQTLKNGDTQDIEWSPLDTIQTAEVAAWACAAARDALSDLFKSFPMNDSLNMFFDASSLR